MKKILFILQSFPSEKSANVLCDERIMNALSFTGEYEVHCLCAKYQGQRNEEIINSIHVHRWNRGAAWELFTWGMHHEEKKAAKWIYKAQRVIMRVKQVFSIPIFPMHEPITCARCSRAAENCYQSHHFDIVIAEHYGLETLLAGYELKRKHREIKFIPLFWDALSGGLGVGYLPNSYTFRKRKKIEEKILEMADMPIAMRTHEQHLRDTWKSRDFLSKVKYLDIPRFEVNGIQKAAPEECDFDSSKINIVFAGNLGARDPERVFELIQKSGNNHVVIHFFTSRKFEEKILERAKKYDIQVRVRGYVEHEVLTRYLANADIFLNLGVDTDCLIPSKIFEYMSYGKMILSTYVNEKDPCIGYFSKYPGAYQFKDGELKGKTEEDVMAIQRMLSEAKTFSFDSAKLIDLFYMNTPKAYCDAIGSL